MRKARPARWSTDSAIPREGLGAREAGQGQATSQTAGDGLTDSEVSLARRTQISKLRREALRSVGATPVTRELPWNAPTTGGTTRTSHRAGEGGSRSRRVSRRSLPPYGRRPSGRRAGRSHQTREDRRCAPARGDLRHRPVRGARTPTREGAGGCRADREHASHGSPPELAREAYAESKTGYSRRRLDASWLGPRACQRLPPLTSRRGDLRHAHATGLRRDLAPSRGLGLRRGRCHVPTHQGAPSCMCTPIIYVVGRAARQLRVRGPRSQTSWRFSEALSLAWGRDTRPSPVVPSARWTTRSRAEATAMARGLDVSTRGQRRRLRYSSLLRSSTSTCSCVQ